MQKRLTGFILMAAFFALPLIAAKAPVHFPLTVRIVKESSADPLPAPAKEDFLLTVNGQPREILDLTGNTVSMSQRPDFPGRNFILSFKMTGFTQPTADAVSYFVTEIMTKADSLLLLTPVKMYQITVTGNKEKMIAEIGKLLEQDCSLYKKNLNAAKTGLEGELTRMKRLFRGGVDDKANITGYKMVGMFLNTFPQSFINFRNRFLFPETSRLGKVLDLLEDRDGQRWWLHFQEGDTFELIPKVHEIIKKIDQYNSESSLARQAFSSGVRQLEQLMGLTSSFPSQQLTGAFLGGDVRYNTIIIAARDSKGNTAEVVYNPVNLLAQVAGTTGGKAVHTVNPEQGVREIANHRDRFFRLLFAHDGRPGGRQVKVTLKNTNGGVKKKLSYKENYSDDEVKNLIRRLSTPRIQITGVVIDKRRGTVGFSIKAITFHREKSFGLVKAQVELLDTKGKQVYLTGNTLRASGREVSISVPLPRKFKGAFKLVIHAYDLIANRLTLYEKDVGLK